MQTPCFDAIFTDLDGTLLNSSQKVGAQDAATIKKLQKAGVPVYFATGRHPAFCSRYARQLQMPIVVACNGALVWDVDARRPLHTVAFAPRQLQRLYDFCAQRGLIYSVQTDTMPVWVLISPARFSFTSKRRTNAGLVWMLPAIQSEVIGPSGCKATRLKRWMLTESLLEYIYFIPPFVTIIVTNKKNVNPFFEKS